MNRLPHFVLFSRSEERSTPQADQIHESNDQGGSWYFRIQSDDGRIHLEAADEESNISRERLELLAVVRGLEAFDQPSSVTLITTHPQIARSVRQGLDYWRERDWMWERFGEKVPMSNRDLWQRIDRANQIHTIRCRTYRIDQAHQPTPRPKTMGSRAAVKSAARRRGGPLPKKVLYPLVTSMTSKTANGLQAMAESLRRWVPTSSPNPHPTL